MKIAWPIGFGKSLSTTATNMEAHITILTVEREPVHRNMCCTQVCCKKKSAELRSYRKQPHITQKSYAGLQTTGHAGLPYMFQVADGTALVQQGGGNNTLHTATSRSGRPTDIKRSQPGQGQFKFALYEDCQTIMMV